MIDTAGDALRAVALGSPVAYPLLFATGVVTSAGPCVAPRYVALAALLHGSRRPRATVGAFVAGVVGAYVAVGMLAASVATRLSTSPLPYGALAVALAAAGIAVLVHGPAKSRHGGCGGARGGSGNAPTGLCATVLLGAAGVLVGSPCCAPLVATVAAITTARGHETASASLLAAFACGHSAPLVAAGALGARLNDVLGRIAAVGAPAIINGSLMLSLAAYYAVLA